MGLDEISIERLNCVARFKNEGQELEKDPAWHQARIIYEAYIRLPKAFQTAPEGRTFLESDFDFENEQLERKCE